MPKESDPKGQYGAGLSNVEYAYMAEEMGKTPLASEVGWFCNICQQLLMGIR
jgi:hypothetical protein